MSKPNVEDITKHLSRGFFRSREFFLAVGMLTLGALLAGAAGVNLGLLWWNYPQTRESLVQGLAWFLLVLSLMGVSERVRRLERVHKKPDHDHLPGPFQLMMADTKNAAMLVGHDEQQANAIAREVLATAIKRGGGWQP